MVFTLCGGEANYLDPQPWDYPICTFGEYTDRVRRLILAVKHRDSFDARPWLRQTGRACGAAAGEWLYQAGMCRDEPDSMPIALVIAPSRHHSWVVREFARAAGPQLAAGLGREVVVLEDALRLYPGSGQRGKSMRERMGSRAGTISAKRRLFGVNVILLDDVVTSGATLTEATRALIVAGARVRAGISLCAVIAATTAVNAG